VEKTSPVRGRERNALSRERGPLRPREGGTPFQGREGKYLSIKRSYLEKLSAMIEATLGQVQFSGDHSSRSPEGRAVKPNASL